MEDGCPQPRSGAELAPAVRQLRDEARRAAYRGGLGRSEQGERPGTGGEAGRIDTQGETGADGRDQDPGADLAEDAGPAAGEAEQRVGLLEAAGTDGLGQQPVTAGSKNAAAAPWVACSTNNSQRRAVPVTRSVAVAAWVRHRMTSEASSTSPRSVAEPVRSRTAKASATGTSALPRFERVCPASNRRKSRSWSTPRESRTSMRPSMAHGADAPGRPAGGVVGYPRPVRRSRLRS